MHTTFTIQIQVKKISEAQRKEYEENKEKYKSLEEDMLDSLLGFSRLFKLLVELKKPIVGHNLLLDLVMMYNQFHEQLPSKSSLFYFCCNPHVKYMQITFVICC
jgi:hypothetical protein